MPATPITGAGQTLGLTASLLDQFGTSITGALFNWSFQSNASGGTLSTSGPSDACTYTAGGQASTDVVLAQLVGASGSFPTAWIPVAVNQMPVSAAKGIHAVEGTAFDPSSLLATFVDPSATSSSSASDYNATVTWGDTSQSTSQ